MKLWQKHLSSINEDKLKELKDQIEEQNEEIEQLMDKLKLLEKSQKAANK